MLHSMKKKSIKSSSKRAAESKYYHIVKPLLTQHNIKVRKWSEYKSDDVYWADFDQRCVSVPIPNCSWSLYVCLHEIGHIVKGSRMHSYLEEYHAEKYALDQIVELKLRGFAQMAKSGKNYVLTNILQDIVFYGLNPNAVRPEVRKWLGVTPRRLKTLALRRCTLILKEMMKDHPAQPFTEINTRDKQLVKKRKEQIHEIEARSN